MKDEIVDRIIKGEEKLFTMNEVTKLLRISRSTLERMINKGDFPEPCIKLGKGYRRWTMSRVKEFLKNYIA